MENGGNRRCQFLIPRKNRTCRMLVKEGKKYCGEHASADPNETDRIPCPLDQNHTIDVKELDEHLIKCNSRLRTDFEWIIENTNSVVKSSDNNTVGYEKLSLKNVNFGELETFVEKVEEVFNKIASFICEEQETHSVLNDSLNSLEYSNEQKKHFLQQASIIGHLEKLNLIKNDICFIEFGAGRAKLAYWLNKCVLEKSLQNCRCLLIEKSGQRYKFENKATREGDCVEFQRIRCSIEHVDLRRIPCLSGQQKNNQSIVAVCKHLCGSGTDAALRCLVNCQKFDENVSKLHVAGAAMAPCCHHRCTWEDFTGQPYFIEFGFNAGEFSLVAQMTSWATCGIALQDHQQNGNDNVTRKFDREQVGRKCKLILDYCRTKFLKNNGMEVEMKYFVPQNVTPENILLIVQQK